MQSYNLLRKGNDFAKAVILVSIKRKEPRNIAANPPLIIDANTPSIGLQELMKKSSPDTLLLGKGSSKDFLVDLVGLEPMTSALRTQRSTN